MPAYLAHERDGSLKAIVTLGFWGKDKESQKEKRKEITKAQKRYQKDRGKEGELNIKKTLENKEGQDSLGK